MIRLHNRDCLAVLRELPDNSVNTIITDPVSVLHFANSNHKSLYPTQKPIELCEWLVKTYSNEGYTVLDPFMGSGSTGLACVNLKRNLELIFKHKGVIYSVFIQ